MNHTGLIDGTVVRRAPHHRLAKWLLVSAAMITIVLLPACKTSPEAANAAVQLTHASHQLSDYYAGLSNQIDDTVALNLIQAEMLGLPFDDSDRTRLNDTKLELGKRAAMAKAMGTLANAYAELAASKSAEDIGNAASSLAHQCVVMKALPGGPAIPDLVGQAGQQLVELIRNHKLQQSSGTIAKTVMAIETLFERETPVYESINKQRVVLAQSIARDLLKKDLVDVNVLLKPALKPFDLTSKLPANQTPAEFRRLAEVKIKDSGELEINNFNADSQALADELKDVSQQVDAVSHKGKKFWRIW
jgi:hypothetical protein